MKSNRKLLRYIELIQKTYYGTEKFNQAKSQRDNWQNYSYLQKEVEKVISGGYDINLLDFKKHHDEMLNICKENFSVYENPRDSKLYYDLFNNVLKSTQYSRFKFEHRPVAIGSIPIGTMNAKAVNLGSIGSLIFFNKGVFSFCNQIAKLITSCFSFIENNADGKDYFDQNFSNIINKINNTASISNRFIDLYSSYCVHGSVDYSEQYFQDHRYGIFITIIRDTMEHFIMAHEYAHICLHHNTKSYRFLTNEDFEEDDRWLMEYEADLFAVDNVWQHYEREGLSLVQCSLGITCFYMSQILLSNIIKSENEGTHPSISNRYEIVKILMEQHLSELEMNTLQIFENTFNYLLEANRNAMYAKILVMEYEKFNSSST